MFTHLTDTTKAFLFFGIAWGLTFITSLLYPVLGELTPFIHTYTPVVTPTVQKLGCDQPA